MKGLICEHYRLIEKLGEGGIAEVWSAEHIQIGQRVAIKLLLPEMSAQPEFVQRFLKEAKAVAAIQHRGVVQIHGYGNSSDGRAYLAMEYLNGETLAACLRREVMLPIARTTRLMRQLTSALAAAHDKQIWHRDLKPDNLFIIPDSDLDGGERLKVLDFGLAKLTTDYTGSTETIPGSVFGTPAYMAPEQCLDSASVDGRADLYSVGCILYRCLCGRKPFEVTDHFALLRAQRLQTPDPPRRYRPEIPAHLDALVMRLLAKSRVQRVQTCAELMAALDDSAIPEVASESDSDAVKTLIFKGGMERVPLPGVSNLDSTLREEEAGTETRGHDGMAAQEAPLPGVARRVEEQPAADRHPASPGVPPGGAHKPAEQVVTPIAQAPFHPNYSLRHWPRRGPLSSSITSSAGQMYQSRQGVVSTPRPMRTRTWILILVCTSLGIASMSIFDCLPAGQEYTRVPAGSVDFSRDAGETDRGIVDGSTIQEQKSPKELLSECARANEDERYDDAQRICEELLSLEPVRPGVHWQCAYAACGQKDDERAEAHIVNTPKKWHGQFREFCATGNSGTLPVVSPHASLEMQP